MSSESESARIRCFACRAVLEGVAVGSGTASKGGTLVVETDPAELPEWVQKPIEESGWTRGKLHCPKCSKHVGGFDFVGSASAASNVHLVASRVDLHKPVDVLAQLGRQQPQPQQQQGEEAQGAASLSSRSPRPSASSPPTSEASSSSISSMASASGVTRTNSVGFAGHADSSGEEMEEDEAVQRNKQRKRRRRKERRTREKERERQQLAKVEQEEKIKRLFPADETEDLLDSLDDSLICAVCLDLLHEPFVTRPCNHVFCEPCLRRLGSKNPMNTLCPMCRTRIVYCDPHRELCKQIRETHTDLYSRRKKFERSTSVYNLPLPWKPGWRNLVAGRPLGGNVFQDVTLGDGFRRFLTQLPYYVPPVILANLVNLLLFVFLLSVVEIVPVLLTAILGSKGVGVGVAGPMGVPMGPGQQQPAAAGPPVTDQPRVAAEADRHLEGSDRQKDYEPPNFEKEFLNSVGLHDSGSGSASSGPQTCNPNDSPSTCPPDQENSAQAPPTDTPTTASTALTGGEKLSPGPVMDATVYYVVCAVSLVAAAFGNFVLVHHQMPLVIGPWLGDAAAEPGRFRRIFDVALVVALCIVPIAIVSVSSNSRNHVVAANMNNMAESPSVATDPASDWPSKLRQWYVSALGVAVETSHYAAAASTVLILGIVCYYGAFAEEAAAA